jgi:hypothetical protein
MPTNKIIQPTKKIIQPTKGEWKQVLRPRTIMQYTKLYTYEYVHIQRRRSLLASRMNKSRSTEMAKCFEGALDLEIVLPYYVSIVPIPSESNESVSLENEYLLSICLLIGERARHFPVLSTKRHEQLPILISKMTRGT